MLIEGAGMDFSIFVSVFGFCGSSASPVALGFFFCFSDDLRPACANVRSFTRKLLATKTVTITTAMANASFSFQLDFALDCLFIAVPLLAAYFTSRRLINRRRQRD